MVMSLRSRFLKFVTRHRSSASAVAATHLYRGHDDDLYVAPLLLLLLLLLAESESGSRGRERAGRGAAVMTCVLKP